MTYSSELKELKESIARREIELEEFTKKSDNVGRIRTEIRIEQDQEQIKLITGQTQES